MSAKELFISDPSKSGLQKLKRAELLEVADHYKIIYSSSAKKEKICRGIVEHLLEEEIISEEEDDDLILPWNLRSCSFKRMKGLERAHSA